MADIVICDFMFGCLNVSHGAPITQSDAKDIVQFSLHLLSNIVVMEVNRLQAE